jgi:hypothetical protein
MKTNKKKKKTDFPCSNLLPTMDEWETKLLKREYMQTNKYLPQLLQEYLN